MSEPKNKNKEITMNDIVQAVLFLISGVVIVALWTTVDTSPHSGWIFIFGMGLSLFGMIRYIIKYFRQPINRSEKQ